MEAQKRFLTHIIKPSTQYVVPVFQRDYKWSDLQCEQLWQDIMNVGTDEVGREHFFGTIVYVSSGDSDPAFTRWMLIDGQQRLTTVLLVITALRDHIRETGRKSDNLSAKTLDETFLKNNLQKGMGKYRLRLRRHDDNTLQALLDYKEPSGEISESIQENYAFFRGKMKGVDPEEVYRGVGKLMIVSVTLDQGDDPQLIFESLNSTGLALSQSDLIRNFILMRLSEADQTKFYEDYWSKVEDLYRGSEKYFDNFVRDFVALRTRPIKQDKADQIYFSFRREFSSISSDVTEIEKLLNKLLRYARYHAAFTLGKDAPAAWKEPFRRLREQVDVPAILIMRLYELYDQVGTLSEADFVDAVNLIESYVFRRAVCGLQTRSYWAEFARLAYRVSEQSPLDSLKIELALKSVSYEFPTNEVFRAALETTDVYGKRFCFYLLDRLENANTKEPTDTSECTIEHVMPQNPNPSRSWKQMLGRDWKEVQREWLHRLGNLTLSGYNSKYQDKSFHAKKTMKKGFQESSVWLNKYISEQDVWTDKEMKQRGEMLAERALGIWFPLDANQKLLDAAKQLELDGKAGKSDVGKVPMLSVARDLFDYLAPKVREFDDDVTELAEKHSVSYHNPSFFMEVLPRSNRIVLLLAVDFNEIDDPSGLAQDAEIRGGFVGNQYPGGVWMRLESTEDIDKALPYVKRVYELTKS